MGSIRLLDCTLRDGGHINQGRFGKMVIKAIIKELVNAKIDIIEAGFLWAAETDEDTARFESIEKLKRYLPENMGNSKISLMADNVDLSHLEPYDGTVEYIRLSFRKSEFEWAEKTAVQLREKGYKCYINPIHGSIFTDEEYLEIIKRVNEINPYGFSIVDTFGAMRQEDLGRIYYLVEHNLNKNITLGVHLHENLGLAYSLAQFILNAGNPTRNITLDGSLFGMGKVPGNLHIEQAMDFMNNTYAAKYALEPVYDAIDEFIMPIFSRVSWGYSIPYALSGQSGVHRTYAEFLTQKGNLRTKDLCRLLNAIDKDHAEIFDEAYMEALYRDYIGTDLTDNISLSRLLSAMEKYQEFVIIAPGASIRNFHFDNDLLERACSISVNFVYLGHDTTFCFFSNAKRLWLAAESDYSKVIITSNLVGDVPGAGYVVSKNDLSYHNDVYSEDSTLMVLNLLKSCGKKKIYIAGFDGFQSQGEHFYNAALESKVHVSSAEQQHRIQILREAYSMLDVRFLTPSPYAGAFEQRNIS